MTGTKRCGTCHWFAVQGWKTEQHDYEIDKEATARARAGGYANPKDTETGWGTCNLPHPPAWRISEDDTRDSFGADCYHWKEVGAVA